MDAVVVEIENLTPRLIEELEVHIGNHCEEVGDPSSLQIDWESYKALQAANAYVLFIMRFEGKVIGYSGYLISPMLRYLGQTFALCDLIYIAPRNRGYANASRLIRMADEVLTVMGVQAVSQHVRADPQLNFGRLLERQGYNLHEYHYLKRVN